MSETSNPVNPTAAPPPRPARSGSPWWTKILPLGLLVIVAYYVGVLIQKPERRIIESAAGALLIYIAFRLSIYQSLAFFLVVYPYPTFTSVGSTNTLLLLVVGIVWAIRVAAGEMKMTFNSLLTPAFPVILLGYLLSTYNIHTDLDFSLGMGIIFDVLSCMCLYFMLVNFVRDERALRNTLYFLGISSILIHIVAVYEALFPGRAFLGGWLLAEKVRVVAGTESLRTGGPFKDFELLSEYCAVTAPLLVFLWLRSPKGGRVLWTVVLCLTVFSQFTTVTRGGFASLMVGLVYMSWLVRKEIGLTRTALNLVVVVGVLAGVGLVLPHMFKMQSLFERFEQTKVVNGMPDSRAVTWTMAVQRIKVHPFLGWGPKYTFGSGLIKYSWPHNGYFYIWITIGLVGLIGYLAAFLTCFFASGRYMGNYLDGSYAAGFLKALHVSWLVFLVDQAKIDFARNPIYFLFTWMLMGFTAVAYQVTRQEARAAAAAAAPAGPAPPAAAPARFAGGRVRKIME